MIVYLHGFNSSPQSHKAQVLGRYLEEQGLGAEYACPALPPLAGDCGKRESPITAETCATSTPSISAAISRTTVREPVPRSCVPTCT